MKTTKMWRAQLPSADGDGFAGRRREGPQVFLPESLARVDALSFLRRDERRCLGRLRGAQYVAVLHWVRAALLPRLRGILDGRGPGASTVPSTELSEDLRERLAHLSPLAAGLVLLHVSWMTQRHHVEYVRASRTDSDPTLGELVEELWRSGAEAAREDTLDVAERARGHRQAELERAVEEYLDFLRLLERELPERLERDLERFQREARLALEPETRELLGTQQLQAMRWTFLGTGMSHPVLLRLVEHLTPTGRVRLEEAARRCS